MGFLTPGPEHVQCRWLQPDSSAGKRCSVHFQRRSVSLLFPCRGANAGSFALSFCQSDRVKNSTLVYFAVLRPLVRLNISLRGFLRCLSLAVITCSNLFFLSSVISISPGFYTVFRNVILNVYRALPLVNALLFAKPLPQSCKLRSLPVFLFKLM